MKTTKDFNEHQCLDVLKLNSAALLVSPEGRILAANDALSELLDYSTEELIGINVGKLISPEDADFLLSNIHNTEELTNNPFVVKGKNEVIYCLSNSSPCINKHQKTTCLKCLWLEISKSAYLKMTK